MIIFLWIFLIPVFVINYIIGSTGADTGTRRIINSILFGLVISALYTLMFLGAGSAFSDSPVTSDINVYMKLFSTIASVVIIIGLFSMYLGVFIKFFSKNKK